MPLALPVLWDWLTFWRAVRENGGVASRRFVCQVRFAGKGRLPIRSAAALATPVAHFNRAASTSTPHPPPVRSGGARYALTPCPSPKRERGVLVTSSTP